MVSKQVSSWLGSLPWVDPWPLLSWNMVALLWWLNVKAYETPKDVVLFILLYTLLLLVNLLCERWYRLSCNGGMRQSLEEDARFNSGFLGLFLKRWFEFQSSPKPPPKASISETIKTKTKTTIFSKTNCTYFLFLFLSWESVFADFYALNDL